MTSIHGKIPPSVKIIGFDRGRDSECFLVESPCLFVDGNVQFLGDIIIFLTVDIKSATCF